ncbi:carbohydrate ABC transporter permease [Paenibacillus psychroresistens]|uniref:Carbohydrate ABC transporter permease n=1 Tax=Paenibacillus psychroresistens TaxID=1778678 RepID=A0A6B8RS17_9BACL|nr:carbohydrate ABC transporter permease [Paenibacillus psychroresistens]QGQ98677.1 carbohydrate ABC transporter permease [Paenibacillus psychroresistens]
MSTKIKRKVDIAEITTSRTFLLVFIILTVYPILFVALTSLKSTEEFYTNVWLWPKKFAWSNFPKALIDAHIGAYFMTSLIVVAISVAIILLFGAMAGYALARLRVPFTGLILFLLLSTTFLPSEMVIMPLYIMMSKMKLLGSYYSLIIPYVGWSLPMTIFIFHRFFKTLPIELLESARMDGCTEAQTFTKITAPLMMPAIATCAIFSFVGLWGELLWASISLSMSSLRTIPFGVISFKSQFATDWGPLSASITLILIPLIILFLFVQKYFVQGITGGAVKG